MAIPGALQATTRKRGNPNWGRPIPPAPALATEFELRVRQLQLTAQFRRRLELGNGVEFLECAGKRIRQAPHRPRRELLVLRLEVEPMDFGEKRPWHFQLAIDKSGIEDQLCPLVVDLGLAPFLHLASHWLKAPLNPLDADSKGVDQVEALCVLGQNGREHAWHNVSTSFVS